MSTFWGPGDTGQRLFDLDNKLLEALDSLRAYLSSDPSPRLLARNSYSRPSFLWNREIMYTCMGTCSAVWLLWQFALKTGRIRLPLIPARHQTIRSKTRLREWLVTNFTLKTEDVWLGRLWTMITSSFSHIDLPHLAANMSTFSSFSRYLIFIGISPKQYATLILGSALTGSLAATFHYAWMENRDGTRRSGLGLSAVCMGLITATAAVSPNGKVSFMGLGPVPMWMTALGYVLFDTYMIDSPTSSIGHAAHVGGAIFGATYSYMILRGNLPSRGILWI
ncbi:hypothetical protein LTS17_004283 [Exophiala oligosperma]